MEAKVEYGERVPWVPLVLLAAVLGFVGSVWIGFLHAAADTYNLGVVVCATIVTPIPFIAISFVKFFSNVMGRKVSMTTLTCLYAVTLVSAYYMSTYYPFALPGRIFTLRFINPNSADAHVAPFMAPPENIATHLMSGGFAVPWGEWFVPMLYWGGTSTLFGIFFIAISNILRASWVDVEKVPFPHTILAYNVMEGKGEGKGKLISPYVVGLVLGFAYQVMVFMPLMFPWFPDVFGWRNNTCPGGWIYLSSDSPLAGIIGLSDLNKNPLLIAIAYLAPMIVLFNAVFWFLIYLVLMQVAYTMGFLTSVLGLSGCGRIWCGNDTLPYGDPFKWVLVSNVGGVLALVIFYLFTNRGYLLGTMRAARGVGGLTQAEKMEPTTYRNSYLMLLGSFICLLAIFLATGLTAAAAFELIMVAGIWFLAGVRIYGLIGFDARSGGTGMSLMKLIYPPPSGTPDTSWSLAMYFSGTQGSDTPQYGWAGPLFASMSAYRMASLAGVDNKPVFKLIVITTCLAPISAIAGFLVMMNTYGQSVLNAPNVIQDTIEHYAGRALSTTYPTTPPYLQYILAGMAIVGFLTIMHARFVWFPFEPIGFLFATTAHTLLEGAWTMFAVAWALKEVTLRVGGTKAYEGYGVPTASGFFLGYVLAIFLAGLISLVRFFFPF
jgi:hypothetical protein